MRLFWAVRTSREPFGTFSFRLESFLLILGPFQSLSEVLECWEILGLTFTNILANIDAPSGCPNCHNSSKNESKRTENVLKGSRGGFTAQKSRKVLRIESIVLVFCRFPFLRFSHHDNKIKGIPNEFRISIHMLNQMDSLMLLPTRSTAVSSRDLSSSIWSTNFPHQVCYPPSGLSS